MPNPDKPKYRKANLWDHVRSTVQNALFGLSLGFFAPLIALMTLFVSPYKVDPLILATCKVVLRVIGIRLRVHGFERLDPKGTYIFLCNHVNRFDHFTLYRAVRHCLRGIEKEENFRIPVYGLFMRRVGQIPIPTRGGTARAIAAIEKAKDVMAKGVSIGILPEGTRTRTGQLGPFKKGAFHLAIDTGGTVVPCVTVGMWDVNRRGDWHIYPGPVDFYIEEPISVADFEKKDVGQLMELARDVMLKRLESAGAEKAAMQPATR